MKAYHEIQPSMLEAILANGLLRTSRGEKGDDDAIIMTDQFLDACRPQLLIKQGVSRDNNLYAYVCVDNFIINITDGARVPLHAFIITSSQQVLELDINPQKCFVSDLDIYDALKSAIEAHEHQSNLDRLAKSYWAKIVSLSNFDTSIIRRPEIMITYDVPPDKIKAL